jgi:phenylpropionate dioxygenase-like ring-hydroxylating dioxygenase large terminal subunit
MDRTTELQLIDELLNLREEQQHYLDEAVSYSHVDHYTSQSRFNVEQQQIFSTLPIVVAHHREVASSGDFVKREIANRSVLVTRDSEGVARVFHNICRHRGTRLVDESQGCKHRFTCPYHAWTYSNQGDLISAPHLESGFPDLDKATYGLKEIRSVERFGFIWMVLSDDADVDIDTYFEPIAQDASALGLDDLAIAADQSSVHQCNWKILVEGGIESYHFKVAHRKTIGPYFEDNLSTYQMLGSHMRSVLMRSSMHTLNSSDRSTWRLRDHANIIYTFFPLTQLLVQQDHVVWINSNPIGPNQTELRLVTLAPKSKLNEEAYWTKNHAITTATLAEDFAIGESIQSGLSSGANQVLTFGRFEGALKTFNDLVDSYL